MLRRSTGVPAVEASRPDRSSRFPSAFMRTTRPHCEGEALRSAKGKSAKGTSPRLGGGPSRLRPGTTGDWTETEGRGLLLARLELEGDVDAGPVGGDLPVLDRHVEL